jgi:steroid delta-isomerase-like uncharacterized protein
MSKAKAPAAADAKASASVRDVARRFIQVWSAGHLGLLEELAAEDIVVVYPHVRELVLDRDAFREMLSRTFESFPDLTITAEEPIVEGERAVVRWFYEGTHRQGAVLGAEATGRRVRVDGITLYRIRDGRVVEETGLVDNLALVRQLRVPPPAD